MRRYLLLPILASALMLMPERLTAQTPAASGEFATRILSDPLFLPVKGQVVGVTAYTFNMPSGDNYKAGVTTGSFKASDNLIDETVAYGLLNDLTLRATWGYGVNSRDTTSATTGAVTTGHSKGFNDPTISATVRALDESRSPLILDLTASYSPNALVSTSGGSANEGSIARGGQAAGVAFALGRVTKSFTIAATGGSTYVGVQANDVLSNGTTTAADAHWSYNAGLATQTRVTDRVSVDAGFAFAAAGNYGVSNVDKGTGHTDAPASTRGLNLAVNYQVSPNRLVAAVTYTYNNYTLATNTFAKPTSDTAVENRTGNVVGVRVSYAFR